MQRWFPAFFACLCVASFAAVIAAGLDDGSRWRFARFCDGRDVFTYYYAAQGILDGVNPYDRVALYHHFGHVPTFVYPIFALPVFLPLALFDLTTAKIFFAALHGLGFIGLILLWRRLLPIDWRLLSLLLPVGFGATAIHDLCSGNVVTFEALTLWLGILLLWRGRAGAFILCAVLAASFKLLWLAVLPLALLRSPQSWRALALTGAGVLALFGIWLLAWQESFAGWLGNLRVTTAIRYNVFTGLREIDRLLGGEIGGPLWQRWESWAYAFWLVFVALIVAILIKRGLLLRSATLFAPLTLLAVWPGNLSYSWLMALPSAAVLVFFLAGQGERVIAAVLTLLLVLPQPLLFWAGMGERFGLGTLVMVLGLWLAFALVMLLRQQQLESWLNRRAGDALIAPHSAPIIGA